MHPTKETLSAFIDGELDATERAEVAALVESDPKLKAFVAEQDELQAALQAAFAPAIAAPIPERLLATVAHTPISFRVRLREMLGAKRGATRNGSVSRFAVPALTMALGLVVGVGLERGIPSTNDFSLSPSSGRVLVRAELARTLDQTLASEQSTGAARIGVTFRDKSGVICRSFVALGGSATTDGIACRRDGDWQIGALVSRPPSATNPAYALAGSSMPDTIRDAIAANIQGAPFDAAAERRARDQGWH
jgi:hypothetical protein